MIAAPPADHGEPLMDYYGATLELKSVDFSQRIISGYAAYHNNLDRIHDVISPQASVKAVARITDPSSIGVYIGHDETHQLPVGIPLRIQATPQGLYTETKIKPGPVGDDLLQTAHFMQANGQPLGMSIAYYTKAAHRMQVEGKVARGIDDYELRHYCYAANQVVANPMALAPSVKSRRLKAMGEGSSTGGGFLVPTAEKDSGVDGALPCPACMALGNGAYNTPGCTCANCVAGSGDCQCADAWDNVPDADDADSKTMSGPQYRVEQDGDSWTVYADASGDGDADDNRAVGTYSDEDTANHVAQALRNEARGVSPDDDEAGEDNSVGPENAKTTRFRGEVKAVWSTAFVNNLEDACFLYIAPGGVKDSDGKTVPRTNRNFPYRTAPGAQPDLPHLRNAIARIPQSTAEGLDDTKKASLQARARKMLEDASDGKTLDESLEWKTGAPPSVRALGYGLIDLSETLAAELKAMRVVGMETKDNQRVREPQRKQLRELAQDLSRLIAVADMVDKDEDGIALNRRYAAMLELASI